MARLVLPDPPSAGAAPFSDAASARAWLQGQPQVEPLQMLGALLTAIEALDAGDADPAQRLAILDALRGAVVLAQSGAEARYTRKPLPPAAADLRVFDAARRLWRSLAVAYLRTVPRLPGQALTPLHRAAMALRCEQYAHFLAAAEVPQEVLHLLAAVLATAESVGLQRTPLADPDYRHLGESNIAGHVAWAFLLQFADPYRLSGAQLVVANRAFSRWRELAGFQTAPDDHPKARALPLRAILGEAAVTDGGPAWLDVRPVARKIRQRIEALQSGQSPEDLKLGRELSAAACIRLLQQLDAALRPAGEAAAESGGSVELVFGAEHCYAALSGRQLNRPVFDAASRAISHERLAIFGFDNLASRVEVAPRVEVPSETWQVAGGQVARQPQAGARLLSPCLLAAGREPARLGVLTGLRVAVDGSLRACVRPFAPPVVAAWFSLDAAAGNGPRIPAFVVGGDDGPSLVVPASAGVRLGSRLFLEDSDLRLVALGTVLERGSDFVRYAVEQQ